jgi:probable rRNA maturation factor
MRPRPDRSAAAPSIDILVQSLLWNDQPAAEATVREAIEAAAALSAAQGEVSVVLTDDAAIRALNRDWRNIDKATNVLSFPAGKPGSSVAAMRSSITMLGDIVVAYETLVRECVEENKSFLHHLAHLTVHGFLHLMGYDHKTDSDAEAMERLESAILTRLSVPDPYLARDLRDV